MKKYLNSMSEILAELQDSGQVFDEGTSAYYKIVAGFIIRFEGGDIYLGAQIPIQKNRYYCYVDNPIELKIGKNYKTKDGRKAFISAIHDEVAHGATEHWAKICKWNINGNGIEEPENVNIVAEWEEEE